MTIIKQISIHALREEGDLNSRTKSVRLARFLSTPSARRATSTSVGCVTFWFLFLSTPSARRATTLPSTARVRSSNFYPRPPRGGRPALGRHCPQAKPISIHALREEGDASRIAALRISHIFLSTPSARRATTLPSTARVRSSNFYPRPPRGGRQVAEGGSHPAQLISIHALREEGDPTNHTQSS